jgi:hypothetical protein
MLLKGTVMSEHFLSLLPCILLFSVGAFIYSQVTGMSEDFPTGFTYVRFVTVWIISFV